MYIKGTKPYKKERLGIKNGKKDRKNVNQGLYGNDS